VGAQATAPLHAKGFSGGLDSAPRTVNKFFNSLITVLSSACDKFGLPDPSEYSLVMASKVIVVTGASRGIGLAVAKHLLRGTNKVVLVSRTTTEFENLKAKYPSQVEYLSADLSKTEVSVPMLTSCDEVEPAGKE
jgi:3-oxoacyl-ACP reductase-like protein